MSNSTILVAKTDQDIQSCFGVMQQLRPHLKEAAFLDQIRAQEKQGYHLVLLRAGAKVAAVAGIRISRNLALGEHVYVDDLVTDSEQRSQGYGELLLQWIEDFTREKGFTELHLDSGVQRYAAHRFYFRQRMNIVFYHFSKKL